LPGLELQLAAPLPASAFVPKIDKILTLGFWQLGGRFEASHNQRNV
jgi:hypothetical protein